LFSSFFVGGGHNKTPTPEDQGWDTKYSTVPPWLHRKAVPLIDALTGAPGMAFPHIRLRSGIANGRVTDALHQSGILSGNLTERACLHHSLLQEKI